MTYHKTDQEIEEEAYREDVSEHMPTEAGRVLKCKNCNMIVPDDETLPEHCPGCGACEDDIEVVVSLN